MENQPVQSPVSEQIQTPVQIPEPKAKFPVMYLVLSVFILLFLASTAFLYYQNMQLKNMLANYQTPVVSPTPTATADPTADWKTYSNTKYSYSLKYPQNLVLESQGPDGPVTSDGSLPTTDAALITLSDPTQTNFSDREILSIDYRELLTAQPHWDSIVVKLGDTQATKFTSSNPEVKFNIYQVSFKNGGLEITANKTQSAILIDQILSTFKFTQ